MQLVKSRTSIHKNRGKQHCRYIRIGSITGIIKGIDTVCMIRCNKLYQEMLNRKQIGGNKKRGRYTISGASARTGNYME